MIIELMIWPIPISLMAILFLYPMKSSAHSSSMARIYAALLMFPCAISGFLVAKLIASGAIISRFSTSPDLPLAIGIHLSLPNALMLIAIALSSITLLFISTSTRFIENISAASVTHATVFAISISADQVLGAGAFFIGSVLLIYLSIFDDSSQDSIKGYTDQFLLQRLCDFLLIAAILLMMAKTDSVSVRGIYRSDIPLSPSAHILYFLSCTLRVISLLIETHHSYLKTSAERTYKTFSQTLIGAGSQILLIQVAPLIFTDGLTRLAFILMAVSALSIAVLMMIFEPDRSKCQSRFLAIAFSSSLVAICAGHTLIAVSLISAVIVLNPIVSLYSTVMPARAPRKAQALINAILITTPIKFLLAFAKLFGMIFNPTYLAVAIYRSPIIIIGLCQIPLRFFHVGNLQRSVLFIAIALAGFFLLIGA